MMKTNLVLIWLASGLLATPALADVTVKNAWVRATPGAAKVSAGYAVMVNGGKLDDVLLGVRTPLANVSHLHSSAGADGVMRMESVDELLVPAGKEVVLRPGDYHVMMMGLQKPLRVGDDIPLTFSFKNQGDVTVSARVMPLAASDSNDHLSHK